MKTFLNIMNEGLGCFEVAHWDNVLSQNGKIPGSDHLLLGYAKMIGHDPPIKKDINAMVQFCTTPSIQATHVHTAPGRIFDRLNFRAFRCSVHTGSP